MADERHFNTDPLTGARTYFSYEEGARESDDIFVLRTEVDVEPLIEANKYEYNLGDHSGPKFPGEMHRVASIPNVVLAELEKQGICTTAGKVLDMKKFKAWLNDSENRFFRTSSGRV
jgi:hypothetical protein